jgi:hypothetical protein
MGLLHIRDDGAWDEAITLQGYTPAGSTNSPPATPPNPAFTPQP